MTPFEDKLVETLVRKYLEKGINVQKIIDNPLFNELPLQVKIEAINKYANELSKNPGFHMRQATSIGKDALIGAGTLGSLAAISDFTKGQIGNPMAKQHLALAAVIGGTIGLAAGGYKVGKEYFRDRGTAKHLREDGSMEALINRTFKQTGKIEHPALASGVEGAMGTLYGEGILQSIFNGH